MVSSLDGGYEIAAEALNKVLQLGCCKFLFWRFVVLWVFVLEVLEFCFRCIFPHQSSVFVSLASQVKAILISGQRLKRPPALVLEEVYQAIGPAMAVAKVCRLVK